MRGKTLYLGLNAPHTDESVVHFPVIRIEPRPVEEESVLAMMEQWDRYTHIVFTSRSAVRTVDSFCAHYACSRRGKGGIAVGRATAEEMRRLGFSVHHIAKTEQAEGIVELLQEIDLTEAYFLWPHSALSRSVLRDYFEERKISVADVIVYDTKIVDINRGEAPNLEEFEKIVFTSPSTVDAFLSIYGTLDVGAELEAIGPITRQAMDFYRSQ